MKRFVYLFCFVGFLGRITLQSYWTSSNVRFVDEVGFFTELMQETVYGLEKYGWWNFRLGNFTQPFNQTIYDWHFQGNATYYDGFLLSIQSIDLDGIKQSFSTNSTSKEVTGLITGNLRFHDVNVGHDLILVMPHATQKYTGKFGHGLLVYAFNILKNMNTNEVTVTASLISSSVAPFGMRILPIDRYSQVMGRHYDIFAQRGDVGAWGPDIMVPIAKRLVTTTVPMPNHCFSCP